MALGGPLGPVLVTRDATLRGRRGTWSHPRSLHVAGVASTLVLRGRRGTHGTEWRPWACFSPA